MSTFLGIHHQIRKKFKFDFGKVLLAEACCPLPLQKMQNQQQLLNNVPRMCRISDCRAFVTDCNKLSNNHMLKVYASGSYRPLKWVQAIWEKARISLTIFVRLLMRAWSNNEKFMKKCKRSQHPHTVRVLNVHLL